MLLLFAFLRPEVDVSPLGGLGHRNVCFELGAVAHVQLNDRPLWPTSTPSPSRPNDRCNQLPAVGWLQRRKAATVKGCPMPAPTRNALGP